MKNWISVIVAVVLAVAVSGNYVITKLNFDHEQYVASNFRNSLDLHDREITSIQTDVKDITPANISVLLAAAPGSTSAFYWKQQIARRYKDAVMVVCHGNTGPDGQWWAYPDYEAPLPMKDLVKRVRAIYPNRRIVLIACNPDALVFNEPGVTYAKESVWFWPDDIMVTNLDKADPTGEGGCGDIFEFTENK